MNAKSSTAQAGYEADIAEQTQEAAEPARPPPKSLATGSSIYLLSNILNAAIPFALLPVLTRYLTPAEYGEVAMFQTWLAALGAFTGLSVHGAAARKYYDTGMDGQELKRFIGACLQVLAFSTLFTFLVVFLLRAQLATWLGLKPAWVLAAVGVSAASFVIQVRLEQWQIRRQAISYGMLQISQSLLVMLLSLLLVVVLLWAAQGRILAHIWTVLAFMVIALYFLHKDKLLAFNDKWSRIREALAFGVPLIPHVAGSFLVSAVDRFVVNAELGLAQAGMYMVAVQFSSVMLLVFDAINKAYIPWLYERLQRNVHAEKQQVVRYTYLYFAVVLFIAALAFLVGPYFITLIAGERFSSAGDAIGWLALGQAFGGMYYMVTNYIFYSKRTGLLSLSTITAGLVNVALLLVLIKPFGIVGAAQAFCIAMAMRFLLTWAVAQRRHPMPWFDFMKTR